MNALALLDADNSATALRSELEPIRAMLAAAYELLGGDHSRMPDADGEAAHVIVERLLARVEGVIESCGGAKAVVK